MNKSVTTHTAKPSIPTTVTPKVRCGIYGRTSTEEGLQSEFNSLDAQELCCTKYIEIQRHEHWSLAGIYIDAGFSGGNTDRPNLTRLIADVKAGLLDVVLVYKIDRLSRSLIDFLNLLKLFEQYNVAFVSVTQQFNTTTPLGKLTLNIMASFGEYEREIIRERTRDKYTASRQKGMWMGGRAPLGYDVLDKKLVVNEREVATVRLIFAEFIKTKSVKQLVIWLREQGIKNKNAIVGTESTRGSGDSCYTPASIRTILNNALYIGKVSHKSTMYDGQQQAIISDEVWQASRRVMQVAPRERAGITKRKVPSVLAGLLKCGGCNSGMTPAYTKKRNGKLYRYYVADAHIKAKCVNCPIGHLSAPEIEGAVLQQLQQIVRTPELVVQAWQNVKASQQVNACQTKRGVPIQMRKHNANEHENPAHI
jgi:DNA invertase Pin-like site-specific DNA recombinase